MVVGSTDEAEMDVENGDEDLHHTVRTISSDATPHKSCSSVTLTLAVKDDWEDGNGDAAERDTEGAATGRDTAASDETKQIDDDDEKKLRRLASDTSCSNWNWLHILYLSLFTPVGVILRAFMGRFFGGDCESNSMGHVIDDWLWPLSHKICVTANGETEQYGGALFIDLPANMFGSLIIGLVTGHTLHGEWPGIPWLSHDHPLQTNESLLVGLRTALCGCMTTFSSWNSQMVLMMDGTANPYLGTQVLAAIFGYMIGFQAALVSFRVGRTISAWFHLRKNPHIFDSAVTRCQMRRRCHHDHLYWIVPLSVFIPVGILVALSIYGDFYRGIAWYRELWIACVFGPIGTILRWKLSTLNGKFSRSGLLWFPAGTFLANFIGSILSAGLTAYWINEENDGDDEGEREITIMHAISLGLAGSLSTVSTFVKECVEIGEKNSPYDKKAFLYSQGTMLSCCLVGLLVYCPIVRYATI